MNSTGDQAPQINTRAPISWQQLASLLTWNLNYLRNRNDQVGLPIAETEAIRGEIRCIKSLLDLPNQAARQQDPLPSELA